MPGQNLKVEVVSLLDRRVVHWPLRKAVEIALEGQGPVGVTVLLCKNDIIQGYNKRWREVDAPTDVLSFKAAPNQLQYLGDVAVSWDFALDQAKVRDVKPIEEAAMLAVHGTLHLLGMDDHTDAGRQDMVDKANEIMEKAGLPTDGNWHSLPH